jgi:D-alanyl-lipoteichoic acid acyltransferase DltB (MBOAT superfamily)
MVFTSPSFILFFLVFYAFYLLLQRKGGLRWQNALLVVAANIFYGAWDVRFLALLWFSALIDFFVAQRIGAAIDQRHKRRWLTFSLTVQLTLLAVFKYLNFGIENFGKLMELMGVNVHVHTLAIILPVGISFYTFQTMAYTIDVYRGKVPPCRDLLNFSAYVSYFPQLVAGPIETPGHLLPQMERPRVITREHMRKGLYWVLIGFFKKLLIADTLAPMVEYTFARPDSLSGISSLLGLMAFSLQIYGDFAGYTYIARGISSWMGIDLALNFERPYLAVSPRDFWRRWHISLSRWLRDYLYISLGGGRVSKLMKYRNLMITMFLGGLWHGASWNFVIWGIYHGTLLCIDHALSDLGFGFRPFSARYGAAVRGLRIAGMYMLTLGGWLLFRVTSLTQAATIVRNIFTNFTWAPEVPVLLLPVAVLTTLLIALHLAQERMNDDLIVLKWPALVRFGFYMFLIITVLTLGIKPQPFIYFQF